VTDVAFSNAKDCNSFAIPLLCIPNSLCLNFAVYGSLVEFGQPSSVTTVQDISEQVPPMLKQLWPEMVSDETERTHSERPVSQQV
jgi:hypothetical protein